MSGKDILTISDVHLGNRSTDAGFILKNLQTFFNDFRLVDNFQDLGCIFIAGDLWDDTLQLSSDCLPEFFRFWFKFCHWCRKKDITLRVLEGTPRHDRLQGKTIEAYTGIICPELDFRYVKELSIEKHEGLGVSILYVPDECRHTADMTYADTLKILHESGLSQVDICVMHGVFRYQLGNIPLNAKVHNEELWLPLVRKFITIGHIHTSSIYERIFAQGSFDRIAHGEEGEKGAFYFKKMEDGTYLPIFLVNKKAKKYISLTLESEDMDTCLGLIENQVKQLPDYSFLRIIAAKGHPVFQGFETIIKKYPLITFSKKILKEKDKEVSRESTEVTYKPVVLNEKTLIPALLESVFQKHILSHEDQEYLKTLLGRIEC